MCSHPRNLRHHQGPTHIHHLPGPPVPPVPPPPRPRVRLRGSSREDGVGPGEQGPSHFLPLVSLEKLKAPLLGSLRFVYLTRGQKAPAALSREMDCVGYFSCFPKAGGPGRSGLGSPPVHRHRPAPVSGSRAGPAGLRRGRSVSWGGGCSGRCGAVCSLLLSIHWVSMCGDPSRVTTHRPGVARCAGGGGNQAWVRATSNQS